MLVRLENDFSAEKEETAYNEKGGRGRRNSE